MDKGVSSSTTGLSWKPWDSAPKDGSIFLASDGAHIAMVAWCYTREKKTTIVRRGFLWKFTETKTVVETDTSDWLLVYSEHDGSDYVYYNNGQRAKGMARWAPLYSAQGIEARQGGDACGSIEDESPVGTADAPNSFPPTPPSKTEGHTISVGVTDEGGSHD